MRRVRIATVSLAVAVGLLGAMAGTASADKPSKISFHKSNDQCIVEAAPFDPAHWTSDGNPSGLNQFWRINGCGAPTTVKAGAIR
jgi:hypothetical protein